MTKECIYGFGTNLELNFETTLKMVELFLERHGFKIFTRLALKDIVGHIDNQIGQYVILGACNPQFAKELFLADPDIGMLMPCNVIVYEVSPNETRVMIKDPARIMDLMNNPIAVQAAINVKDQMEQIIEELQKGENTI